VRACATPVQSSPDTIAVTRASRRDGWCRSPSDLHADDGQRARELVGEAIARLKRPLPKVAAMLVRLI
jgi:hypothetical protein